MNTFIKWWTAHRFKLMVASSIVLIVVLWWFKDPSVKGTWSCQYHYDPVPTSIRSRYKTPHEHDAHQRFHESKGEVECRRVLEKIFQRSFTNQRPLFLTNNVTGKPLEIDCCNLDMKLGVEYNGRQHYEYTKRFHKNYETFKLQQYRDEMKKRLCEDNHFTLIVVPYTIPIEKIESFIMSELSRHRIKF